MIKKLLVLFLPLMGFSQAQIGQSFYGDVMNSSTGSDVAISNDGNIIAIAAVGMISPTDPQKGGIKLFQLNNDTWVPYGQTMYGDPQLGDIGIRGTMSMSSEGNILALGSPGFSTLYEFGGRVKIVQLVNEVWEQVGDYIDAENALEYLGAKLVLSSAGDIVAVRGSTSGFERTGFVRVYHNDSGIWTKLGTDLMGSSVDDNFGLAISLSEQGNILAIGASNNMTSEEDYFGCVKVFQLVNNEWSQIGQTVYGLEQYDRFGSSVSLSSDGTIMAVGAPNSDDNGEDSGLVVVFQLIDNEWVQMGNTIEGETLSNFAGDQVSLSSNGEILAISSPSNDVHGNYNGSTWLNYGSVSLYKYSDGSWGQIGIDIDGEQMQDYCGDSIDLSSDGSRIIVASTGHNYEGVIWNAGQVRVYTLESLLSLNSFSTEKANIFPNPTYYSIDIELDKKSTLQKVILSDELGRVVNVFYDSNINLSDLSTGVYFVKIVTDRGSVVKKIIKK